MSDTTLLGPWVRRFLMEYLIGDRNLARNTQRSYRDTLRQLLPIIARSAHKRIDALHVEDLSADRIRRFLRDLEESHGRSIATRNQPWQRFIRWRSSSACIARNMCNGAERFAPS